MANWWEDAPIVQDQKEGDWYSDAPLVEDSSTPPTDSLPLREPVATPTYSGSLLGQAGVPMDQGIDPGPVPTRKEANEGAMAPGMEPAGGFAVPNVDDVIDQEGAIPSTVYDNLEYEDALKLYQKIAQDPRATTVNGPNGQPTDIMFGKYRVPFPSKGALGGGSGQSVPAKITQGLADQTMNALQGAVAVGDTVMGTNAQARFEQPEVKSGDLTDAFLHDAPGTIALGAAGLGLGGKVAEVAGNVLPKIPYVSKAGGILARVLGSEVGSSVGTDEDASGVLVGENALVKMDTPDSKIFFDTSSDQSDASKTVYKKLNLALDNAIVGNVVGSATRAIGVGLGAVKRTYFAALGPSVSKEAREQMYNNEVLGRFFPELDLDNNQAKVAAASRLQTLMEKGQSEYKLLQDTRPAEKGGGGIVQLDPFAAIALGAKAEGDDVLEKNVTNFRGSLIQAGTGKLGAKQASYDTNVIEPFKEDLYKKGGSETGVEASRSAIVRSGQEDIGQALGATREASLALEKGTQDYAERIRSDVNFGAEIQALEKDTGININKGVRQTSDEVASQARVAEEKMSDIRRSKYEKIPNTVKVDRDGEDGFNQFAYEEVLDKKGNPKIDKETGEPVLKWKDGLPTDVKRIIEEADGSFKTLHNKLIPLLTSKIAKPNGDPTGLLQDMKDNILDYQINNLRDLGGAGRGKVADAIDEARKYNMEYMRYFGKGATLADISKPTVGKRGLLDANAGNDIMATRSVRSSTRDNILSGDDNLERGEDFVDVLNRSDVKGDPETVFRSYIAQASKGLRGKIQNGDVTKLDKEDFIKQLESNSGVIASKFPEKEKELNTLISDLKSGKENITNLESKYDLAVNESSEISKRVGAEQRPFYQDGVAKQGGQSIFSGLFKDKNYNNLDNALKRAEASGETKGIQASLAQDLKGIDLTTYSKDQEHFNTVIDKVYKDTPEAAEGIKEAYRLARDTRSDKGLSSNTIGGLGANADKNFKGNINKLVTLMFGVLNPTATRVRNLTSVLAEDNAPSKALRDTIDTISSDPKAFSDMLKSTNKENFFSPGNKRRVIEFMNRASVRSGPWTSKDREYFNEQWDAAQTNDALEDDNEKK